MGHMNQGGSILISLLGSMYGMFYIHLVDFYGKCREIYNIHGWMDGWMMYGNDLEGLFY